jgi:hemolysin activation/secretion protein
MIRSRRLLLSVAMPGLIATGEASAQVVLDRADPTITEQALPTLGGPLRDRPRLPEAEVQAAVEAGPEVRVTPQAIIISGTDLPASLFADVITRFVGRELGRAELSALVADIAGTARSAGYPLATAMIEAQDMSGGVLRVRLDAGRVDAVRIVGASNARADRLLSRALATRRPVRRADLERAILLVGDLPGLTVRESSLIRQDGFTILLVTVEEDRLSAYAQLDNRGSKEVGPVRSTVLASARRLLQSGDELALLLSNMPLQPSEFAFIRGRYAMPLGPDGGSISLAGSYGRSNPGASLATLNLVGKSADAALAVVQPVARSRSASLIASLELRHIDIRQRIDGAPFRRDRLDTLTATLEAVARLAGGTARTQFQFVAGLPFAGITREGDQLTSRRDGDARFIALGFLADWTLPVTKRLTLLLAATGQVASRPLLATAEIGAGGPGFGRAYDYAERSGDEGLLGSAELRVDTGRIAPGLVERSHVYAFVDGGAVSNRGPLGRDGGTLASAGAGVRFGIGRFDAMAEAALPLNADRLDTGDRRPRFNLRISRSF